MLCGAVSFHTAVHLHFCASSPLLLFDCWRPIEAAHWFELNANVRLVNCQHVNMLTLSSYNVSHVSYVSTIFTIEELKSSFLMFCLSPTLQRIPRQPQLADDVARDVCLHQLSLLGVVLCCLQQMVELFRVELLL